MSAFDLAVQVRDELEDDQEMITLHQFGTLFVDWTNAGNLLNAYAGLFRPFSDSHSYRPAKDISDKKVHADLAISILLALYDSDRDDDVRKTLCQLLGQLDFIGSALSPRTILKLYILTDRLQDQCPLGNTASDRIFDRFKGKLMKSYEKEIEDIDPQAYLDDDFRQFYDFIGVKAPEAPPEPEEPSETAMPPSTPVLKERSGAH
ncbi:hypothetical protein PM082_007852 [Marasmius tenuissimus]|nr:hypothetical protein PM082_007852 [Marasmius tenuissimus]